MAAAAAGPAARPLAVSSRGSVLPCSGPQVCVPREAGGGGGPIAVGGAPREPGEAGGCGPGGRSGGGSGG